MIKSHPHFCEPQKLPKMIRIDIGDRKRNFVLLKKMSLNFLFYFIGVWCWYNLRKHFFYMSGDKKYKQTTQTIRKSNFQIFFKMVLNIFLPFLRFVFCCFYRGFVCYFVGSSLFLCWNHNKVHCKICIYSQVVVEQYNFKLLKCWKMEFFF